MITVLPLQKNKLLKGQQKTSMTQLRQTRKSISESEFKSPSISELRFPKMKSHLNSKEVKLLPYSPSLRENHLQESTECHNKLVRSYSMSLIPMRKDMKTFYSPKKKIFNPNSNPSPQKIINQKSENSYFHKNLNSPSKNIQPLKISLFSIKTKLQQINNNHEINFQNIMNENSKQFNLRNTLYPGVKFQPDEYAQKRSDLMKKILLQSFNNPSNQIQTSRKPRSKPLFNGKFLINKKQKDQEPDELIARKLVWDGKEMNKIDHKLIHKEIIKKSKSDKNQRITHENSTNTQGTFTQFMRLSAWDFQQDSNQRNRLQMIKISKE